MNRTRKIAATAVTAAALGLGLAACSHGPNAQQREQQQQTQDTQALDNNQPLPHYTWSMERQILIDAENASAFGTQSTSFFFIQGVRDPVFVCPSLGLGVPDTAQISNPSQIAPISGKWGGGATTLPQEDPYGIYTPPVSEGTFVVCVGSGGKPYLHRAEEFVDTVLGPARWDSATHTEVVTGAPSYHVKVKR